MEHVSAILGIDVGSVSVSMVVIDKNKALLHQATAFHHGNVKSCLADLLAHDTVKSAQYVSVTDTTPSSVYSHAAFDEQVTLIRAAREFHADTFDALLHIGGEKFSLSHFDELGNYTGARTNTSCAAGTGSFLDQQARRLHLDGSAEISEKALANDKPRPDIATRCAVFAKTDLIHAQQEGYNIRQICDGLCHGLAKNIANTLFKGEIPGGKILFCGGVSKNASVTRHLETMLGISLTRDEFSHVYGAAGAAFCLWDELRQAPMDPKWFDGPEDFFIKTPKKSSFRYPELSLSLSDYPDFACFKSYMVEDVETDIYTDPRRLDISGAFLGLDVGSTSTKSILINQDGVPVMGCYTKTASRPVRAVQKIFKAMDGFLEDFHLDISVKGCGTTGSGRRISGRIIGADIEPDEITAHATAAVNLNRNVDTIIEIGGQDAKFTLLRDGMVTSSVMNTVCAAGTGSFIEEQALKLSCPLSDYSDRAEGVKAPVSSDRCTVFMERDINYYFAEGYEKNEILASVLHSVRDNYLTKVANVGKIGNCILFQGATARNKALVAAFEQKLNKPIHVSRFCHLTGALGVALLAMEQNIGNTGFRGFGLWKKEIPVRREVCQLCLNHCKLTIADMDGQALAYGFLCGRDYDTKKTVPRNNPFDLLKQRRKLLPPAPKHPVKHDFTIGLPAALHLFEELDTWQTFFSRLGIKTITSRKLKQPVKLGKSLSAAEFCAPVVALHGHVAHLLETCDYVFLPYYFEDKQKKKGHRRQHCYYTQFAPSVLSCLTACDKERLMMPTINFRYTNFHIKLELYKVLKQISPDFIFSFFDINSAWDKALEVRREKRTRLRSHYETRIQGAKGIKALLLGRPYTVLSPAMNNHIPGIFEKLGIPTLFQDMLALGSTDFTPIQPILREIHWKHAAHILKAAYVAALSDDLYPVYITSFKCSPDSFNLSYFKQIMEHLNKPYLVLELDEHDSSVGYETRIEAAARAFNNHYSQNTRPAPARSGLFSPCFTDEIQGKTILFPNFDTFTGHLITAVFQSEGYNALLLEETDETLKKSILTNTGQCIPLNAVAAAYIHTVKKHGLDPEKTVLWLNESEIACNIKMYPYHIQQIIQNEGNGFEKTGIYKGEFSLFDISFKASTNAYYAYMFGGFLRSIGCKLRPYEVNRGETDRVLAKALAIIKEAFATGGSKEKALAEAIPLFLRVKTRDQGTRPKVAIFGDLYVRDNDVMNQDLIHFIEDNGGEVVTTPYYKYVKIIANSYFRKWFKEGKYMSLISNSALLAAMTAMEKKYYPYFEPLLREEDFKVTASDENVMEEYGLRPEHTGESMDNLLKIHHIVHEHPDLALLIQTNPAFCCPGLVTEAMAAKIEAKTGVPIVSITYDVSGGNKNKVIVPFITYLRKQRTARSARVPV